MSRGDIKFRQAILGTTVALGTALMFGGGSALADTSSQKMSVAIEVLNSCEIGATGNDHTGQIYTTLFNEIGDDTVFTVQCNDAEGWVIYAVGESNDEEGNTKLIGSGTADGANIETGTAQSGDTSSWSMKLKEASVGLAIQDGYDDYAAIPAVRTAVIKREGGMQSSIQDTFKVNYGVYASGKQHAGNYTGKVGYYLFHPSSSGPEEPMSTMQDFSCDQLSYDEVVSLMDERDGNQYQVAKLKDGKCWMVENLRLGGAGLENRTLTSADSDVSSSFTLPESTTSGFTTGNYDTAWVYVDGTYGGYYSWKAATAGTGTGSMSSGNAGSSICPKGWRLPTGGSGGEFEVMAKKYGSGTDQATSTALRATPAPGFVLSGYYNDNSSNHRGDLGYFWSSTDDNSNYAYNLNIKTSGVVLTNYSSKYHGFSVRCVAR